MTQEQVAAELGIPRKTIDDWESGDISNTEVGKANTPDWRVKLAPEKKLLMIERALAGENQKVLADEFKITQGRVSQIVTAYEKQQAKAAAEAARGGPEVARQLLATKNFVPNIPDLRIKLAGESKLLLAIRA